MSRTIRQALSVALFLALLLGSVVGVGRFLDKTDVDEKYKQFFGAETNFDVVFLGTSHTYNTVLPQELWAAHGIASYNWGSSNCTIPIDYYVLRQLCRYTAPQLVVIDLFGLVEYAALGNGKYRPDALDQQRVQFDAFPLSRLKIEAVNDIFDDYGDRWDFLFKLAIYHNRWREIGRDNFSPRNIPQKGAAFVLGVGQTDYREGLEGTASPIETLSAEYLGKIVDFCRDEGIEVLFVTLPFVADQASADAAASAEKLLEAYPDCPYLNMLNLGIPDYETDVYLDGSHLNYIGAAAVTEWLGAYLAERCPELVRRGDPAFASWDRDYGEYVDYKISRFREGALTDNLQLLYGCDFAAELTLAPGYSLADDPVLAALIRRLDGALAVTEGGDPGLRVTDRRTGSVVFTDSISP